MVENIVKYTNISHTIKYWKGQRFSEGDVQTRQLTAIAQSLAVFDGLFLIAVKRGNHAEFSEFSTSNGT